MKILLLQAPVEDFYDTDIRHVPYGLACLKAYVEKHEADVEIKILDFHHGWGRQTVKLPAELSYLKDYYPCADQSPFGLFHQYYHFGASYEQIAQEVLALKPDLVGIGALFTPYYREVLASAKAIKKVLPVPILLGGAQASTSPEMMLNSDAVDFVIRGEGEKALLGLIQQLKTGAHDFNSVAGLCFKQKGKPHISATYSEPLSAEELPLIEKLDWPMEQYEHEGSGLSFIFTSRGCPYRCSFCSVPAVFSHSYRRRSNESILLEMRRRYEEGYRKFDFEDDNLVFHELEFIELLKQIKIEFPDVQLFAMNGLNYQLLTPTLLRLMKESGFQSLNLSLVSMDAELCHELRRPREKSSFRQIVGSAHELGYKITGYFIIGLPGDSLERQMQTLISMAQLPLLIGASPFYMVSGSDAYGQSAPTDIETAAIRARLSALGGFMGGLSTEEIYSLFIATRIINFLKAPEQFSENRREIGFEILRKLKNEKRLSAWNGKGYIRLSKFSYGLWAKLATKLSLIKKLDGQSETIQLREFL